MYLHFALFCEIENACIVHIEQMTKRIHVVMIICPIRRKIEAQEKREEKKESIAELLIVLYAFNFLEIIKHLPMH